MTIDTLIRISYFFYSRLFDSFLNFYFLFYSYLFSSLLFFLFLTVITLRVVDLSNNKNLTMIPESGRGDSGVVLFIMSIHRGECHNLYHSFSLLLSLSHTLSLTHTVYISSFLSLFVSLF